MFKGKKILIGIGGGIAAYRVAELIRLLIKQEATVRCVMTKAACHFVQPLTFEALTGKEVHTELFDLTDEREMGHIKLARWADVMLVAPATADLIAKYAHGIADDLLSTMLQAREGHVLLAPAMNVAMWESDAVQRNLEILRDRSVIIVGPEEGELACGEEGMGRMSEPEALLQALYGATCPDTLAGQRWVINTGATREHWDTVRFMSNAASGKLGCYLASAARARGAEVDLVAGPGVPVMPSDVARHDVVTASDMLKACSRLGAHANVFIAAAAISDYRFMETHHGKIKSKKGSTATVELIANEDVLAHMAAMDHRPAKIIAFAAECEDHVQRAKAKLQQKGADAIFANDASAMGKDEAGGWWITGKRTEELVTMPKLQLAERLIDLVEGLKPR